MGRIFSKSQGKKKAEPNILVDRGRLSHEDFNKLPENKKKALSSKNDQKVISNDDDTPSYIWFVNMRDD